MIDKNLLNEIKKNFRQSMNADLSNSMREHGLEYKINFGVPSPRIKLIAEKFDQDNEVAQYLWDEDVRESKMLATYLYPVDMFDEELALKWIDDIKYPEISDQLCMNLLSKTDYALDLAFRIMECDSQIKRYTAYRLVNRLLINSKQLTDELFDKLLLCLSKDMVSDNTWLSLCAVNLLEKCFDNESNRKRIMDYYKDWRNSEDNRKSALYDMIVFWNG